MSALRLVCDPPALDWAEAGPRAPDFGDVYFSAEDGLAESRAVFLEGCGLPEAWAGRDVFTVCELGFGTGLNALALWDLWRRKGPKTGVLHLVTVEKHPLPRAAAARALSAWPELASLAAQLVATWPPPLKGAHRLRFDDDRFHITIVQDEAEAALAQIEARIDAFFLDGFAPARNPGMWSPGVLAQLARLAAPGARAATFTVAGSVRRGLAAGGFRVEKKPGHGRKRERLEAVFEGTDSAPGTAFLRAAPVSGPVAILGGGIAGASLAFALARRGREAVILDPAGLAAGASGAPCGLLTPRLENADRPHVRACLAAFEYARSLYEDLPGFHGEGALRLAKDAGEAARLRAIADAMGEGYDWDEGRGGLWMARAGRFEPAALARALAGETKLIAAEATRIERQGDALIVRGGDGGVLAEASAVIIAAGAGAARWIADLAPGAGRIVSLRGAPPPHPVAWGGYAAAAPGGRVILGATHERGSDPGDPEAALETLLEGARERLPDLAAGLDPESAEHWQGVRAAAPDRLPVCGPLETPGLSALAGLGARGFAHAPLLAEALASDLCGEPSPLERAGRETLHPTRFAARRARRSVG